eukprot:m.344855 g.344855  ORF g.344855 m.344855 type:complete len:227 (-) comp25337_c0_seq1:64-744(-)
MHVHTGIVLFNGPPHAGKTKACSYLLETFRSCLITIKSAVIEEVCRLHNISEKTWYERYTPTIKDEPWEILNGKSMREVLNEHGGKQKHLHGQNYWTIRFTKKIVQAVESKNYEIVCVDDLGFPWEIDGVSKYFQLEDILVCRVVRSGTDFEHDAREWVWAKSTEIMQRTILNPAQLHKKDESFKLVVMRVIEEWQSNRNNTTKPENNYFSAISTLISNSFQNSCD